MPAENPILPGYESIWTVTQSMLEAATNSEWDRLIQLEQQREVLVAQVQAAGIENSEGAALQARLMQLIQQTLEADGKIRTLTEAWMAELKDILGSVAIEQKLQNAYQVE